MLAARSVLARVALALLPRLHLRVVAHAQLTGNLVDAAVANAVAVGNLAGRHHGVATADYLDMLGVAARMFVAHFAARLADDAVDGAKAYSGVTCHLNPRSVVDVGADVVNLLLCEWFRTHCRFLFHCQLALSREISRMPPGCTTHYPTPLWLPPSIEER